MKRDFCFTYDFSRRLVDYNAPELVLDDDSVDVSQSPSDSLLSLVYAIDERTKLPTGDLQYLVSDKANPQVKEFILANLMQDVSSAKNVADNIGLSDDDLLSLSRNAGESDADYAQRLNTSIHRDLWLMDEYKKRNVPPKSEESPVPSE